MWSSNQAMVPCAPHGFEPAGICSNTPWSERHSPTPRLGLYKHLPLIIETHLSFASQHHFSNTFTWISSHLCFPKNSYYRDSFSHFLFSLLLFQNFQMPTKKNADSTPAVQMCFIEQKHWKNSEKQGHLKATRKEKYQIQLSNEAELTLIYHWVTAQSPIQCLRKEDSIQGQAHYVTILVTPANCWDAL